MEIDAGRANSEGPARSKTDLREPKWLVRLVQALVPPGLGSPNELINVLLETRGSISQAVLRIPGAIAAPALGRARDAFYLLSLPLLIGLAELYAGHPGAAEISAPQMAVNGAGWVALLMTWAPLKKLNRQTAAVFDQRIRELHAKDRV